MLSNLPDSNFIHNRLLHFVEKMKTGNERPAKQKLQRNRIVSNKYT